MEETRLKYLEQQNIELMRNNHILMNKLIEKRNDNILNILSYNSKYLSKVSDRIEEEICIEDIKLELTEREYINLSIDKNYLINIFTRYYIGRCVIECNNVNKMEFLIKSNNVWKLDKDGIYIKKNIINPLLKRMHKFLNDRMIDLSCDGKEVEMSELLNYQKGINNIILMGNDKVQNMMLKRIGSVCILENLIRKLR
jgi:hypothetical protein